MSASTPDRDLLNSVRVPQKSRERQNPSRNEGLAKSQDEKLLIFRSRGWGPTFQPIGSVSTARRLGQSTGKLRLAPGNGPAKMPRIGARATFPEGNTDFGSPIFAGPRFVQNRQNRPKSPARSSLLRTFPGFCHSAAFGPPHGGENHLLSPQRVRCCSGDFCHSAGGSAGTLFRRRRRAIGAALDRPGRGSGRRGRRTGGAGKQV